MDANFALGDLDQLEIISRTLESMPETPPDLTAALSLLLSIGKGKEQQAQAYLQRRAQLARSGEVWASSVAFDATSIRDFDLAGEMLLQAYREKDGTWSYPIYIRLPEQAPDSEAWQEFWRQPGVAELAELRRSHGLNPNAPTFGSGAKP